ncbi:MAG: bacteriochlorophyll 4-vinyl reductase [Acetobacteraceae bacterium]|nr:bacteriochlorophyll 4-vinyl reductase [Acetobacteraceae bacterium]
MVAPGRIGPNAITRVAEVLAQDPRRGAIFAEAGIARHLLAPPDRMVEEGDVTRLHAALRARLGVPQARAVGRRAGEATAAYLLAHRIPRPMQAVLRVLPGVLASRVLMAAIGRHSWTFAGTARFSCDAGNPTIVRLAGCALCRGARSDGPLCDFYGGCLDALFRHLVSPRARAVQVACAAAGDTCCAFRIGW